MNNIHTTKTQEGGIHLKNVLSIIAGATGLLSLLFLLCQGITYTVGYYPGDFNMAAMIFGYKWAGINPGLMSAFIIMLIGAITALLMNFKTAFGFVSILCFLTSAILWFCTIPLYGNYSASLGAGAICLGIFNLVDMILVFVGATYR